MRPFAQKSETFSSVSPLDDIKCECPLVRHLSTSLCAARSDLSSPTFTDGQQSHTARTSSYTSSLHLIPPPRVVGKGKWVMLIVLTQKLLPPFSSLPVSSLFPNEPRLLYWPTCGLKGNPIANASGRFFDSNHAAFPQLSSSSLPPLLPLSVLLLPLPWTAQLFIFCLFFFNSPLFAHQVFSPFHKLVLCFSQSDAESSHADNYLWEALGQQQGWRTVWSCRRQKDRESLAAKTKDEKTKESSQVTSQAPQLSLHI